MKIYFNTRDKAREAAKKSGSWKVSDSRKINGKWAIVHSKSK